MTILTDFIVDHIYPVTPREGVQTVARVKGKAVGAHNATPAGGSVTFLGFRPRDDQSMSLGYEERHWFEILNALGAYPGSGRFEGVNDNPDYVSRTSGYLTCAFPNGAVAIAPHLRHLEECWPGGFARKPEEDKAILEQLDLPSEAIALDGFKVAGHEVTFQGHHALTFRVDGQGRLIAFCGRKSDRITIDGNTTVYADTPMHVAAWAPVEPRRRVNGGAVMELFFQGTGAVHVPIPGLPDAVHVVTQGPTLGSRGEPVPSKRDGDILTIALDKTNANRWLFVVPGEGS